MEGAKLSGLAIQTSSFEQLQRALITLLPLNSFERGRVAISLPTSIQEMDELLQRYQIFTIELKRIQNFLSKPFPFINEIVELESGNSSYSTSNSIEKVSLNGNNTPESTIVSSDYSFSSMFSTRHVSRALNSLPNISRLGDMVSTVGRNVRKYAETGYQRMGAMPSRASAEDLDSFLQVNRSMIEGFEKLEKWLVLLEEERRMRSHAILYLPESQREVYHSFIESLLLEHAFISTFLMTVVCELLLRDLQILATRYIHKMRKSFSYLPDSQSSAADDEDDDENSSEIGKMFSFT